MGDMPKIENLCSIGMCVMKLGLVPIVYTQEIGTPDYGGVVGSPPLGMAKGVTVTV